MVKVKGKGKKSVVRKAFNKKRPQSSIKTKSLVKAIKNIALSQAETKYTIFSQENQQLYHNGGTGGNYIINGNMLSTTVGNTQITRLGDVVQARGISVKLWLSNKLDRPNVMYRIFVVTAPPDQTGTGTPSALFKADHGNKMIDSINTDKYKVIFHKMIRPFAGDYSLESGATNKEHSTYYKFYLNLKNRQVRYSADSGSIPQYQNNVLLLGLIAYDAYGTATTDNIASYSQLCKFYFKDP